MSQAVARPSVRWRQGATTRKSILLVHIASAGAWIGIDVVMAVLVFTALLSDDEHTKALSFRALELVAVGPLLATGLVCLLTGILLGLGSKYGLVRYWWVVVKLVLNLLLTALVLVALAPEVASAAERARQWGPRRPSRPPPQRAPRWRRRARVACAEGRTRQPPAATTATEAERLAKLRQAGGRPARPTVVRPPGGRPTGPLPNQYHHEMQAEQIVDPR